MGTRIKVQKSCSAPPSLFSKKYQKKRDSINTFSDSVSLSLSLSLFTKKMDKILPPHVNSCLTDYKNQIETLIQKNQNVIDLGAYLQGTDYVLIKLPAYSNLIYA